LGHDKGHLHDNFRKKDNRAQQKRHFKEKATGKPTPMLVTATNNAIEIEEFIGSLTTIPPDEVIKPVKYYPTVELAVDLNELVPIFDKKTCLAA
jgi:hypothetical protein